MQKQLSAYALSLVVISSVAAAESIPHSLMVRAGSHDRHQTPVVFTLPPATPHNFSLQDSTGNIIDLQVDADGRACFIQNSLRRGDSKQYAFVQKRVTQSGGERLVDLKPIRAGMVELGIAGRPVVRYSADKSPLPRENIKTNLQRGGYLHPVFTPTGKIVTDDYPTNHLHHHGIWFAWTKTSFDGRSPDFWNMGGGLGTVEGLGTTASWSGPNNAGFRSRHRHVDLTAPEPTTVLNETWDVTAYWIGRDGRTEYWVFDLVSTQQCAGTIPLKLPEYHYGGLGFRGLEAWNDKNKVQFLTSEGLTNRVEANTARARWCDISGTAAGEVTGIAILGHPKNFRAPQPMRVHPSEPFFCFAPQQLGDMEITPGTPYVSRYRFVVHDGPPVAAHLNRFWNDFADPPAVEVAYEKVQ